MPHPLRAAILAALLPLPAHAACLTAADLDGGIEILFSNSDRTTIHRLPDGRFAWEETYAAAGFAARFNGLAAIYPDRGYWAVRSGQPDPTTGFQRRYEVPAASLPIPDATGGTFATTFAEATGDLSADNWTLSNLTLAWGPTAALVLPDCTYDATALEFRIDWANGSGGGSTSWYYYLPALGVGFIIAAQNHGGDVIAAAPVAIRPLDDM